MGIDNELYLLPMKVKPKAELPNRNRRDLQRELRFILTPRFMMGITLITASFLSAFYISSSERRSIEVWGAAHDLAVGDIIEVEDIAPVRVLLPENADRYLSSSAELIGATVLRPIGGKELLPSYAIGGERDLHMRRVPISFPQNSLPNDLEVGDEVDLYAVPIPDRTFNSPSGEKKARIVLASISVNGLESKEKNFGGETAVTLLMPEGAIPTVLTLTIDQRLILVKRPGS